MKLNGKTILIFGGTSGFGLATAQAAAKEGANVVVASSRQESVDQALKELPPTARGFVVHVDREEEVRVFFAKFGRFDHLVFTAGDSLSGNAEIKTISLKDAKAIFDVRLWGVLLAVKYGGSLINAGGSITLANGVVGLRPWKGWAVTAALSGACESFTRALAVELAPIRVNSVSAGMVDTPFHSNMSESDRKALFEKQAQHLPVGRIGTSEDIAEAFLFLIKDGYSTGQTIVVDGGSVLI